MAAAPTQHEAARAAFEAALQERNFGERCHQLAAVGRSLRAAGLASDALEAALDGLVDDGKAAGDDTAASAFCARCVLIAAKAAGCSKYARKLLGHPSKTVRFEAARGGLLTVEDARDAFLSADSSHALKRTLVGCKALPCDKAVMDHAWQLFGTRDKERVWEILARATDEELIRSWLKNGSEMSEWLSDCEKPPPFLPQIGMRFPTVMVELVKQGCLSWQWYWLKDVLNSNPSPVLQAAFLEGHCDGSGPYKAYDPDGSRQEILDTLASWGWRHRPDVMLELCRDLAVNDGRRGVGVVQMAKMMMQVTSTRYYITTNQKIAHLGSIWSQIPASSKTSKSALQFVKLLPSNLKEHRAAELKKVVDTFWKIVAEVGRAARREVLVGQEAAPECTGTLSSFAQKLPPPLAVDQLFRILEEFEAATPAYQFFQSSICRSRDGRYDALGLRVFERYLQKEGVTAVQATNMFQVLLDGARSRDIVQKAFGSLVLRLGDKMELGLMLQVVTKMRLLEKESIVKATAENTPPATMPVPVHWASFVAFPEDCSPRDDFLLHVLHSGTGETELLGVMLKKYGPCFFWDCLDSALRAAATPKPKRLLQPEPPPPDLELLRKVDLSSVGRPLPQRTVSGALHTEGGTPASVYFAELEEVKRKTLGKDQAARQTGYVELMTLAQKDVDPAKAFADLLPFLVGRFKGEQDPVRAGMLRHLLVTELLPVKLWEDNLAHLQALWKICAKMRETDATASGNILQPWGHVGDVLVKKALREWGDSSEPSTACAFGVEVAGSLDLPSIFVSVQGKCKEDEPLSDAAARWVFLTSVPIADDGRPAVAIFWDRLGVMAKIVKGRGAERALWERWPFVAEHWRAILAEGPSQKAVQFTMVGVVELLTKKASSFALPEEEGQRRPAATWWAPLECAEYQAAVSSILGQMESGEIPAKQASSLLVQRMHALLMKEARACEGDGPKGANWKNWGRRRRPRVEWLEEEEVCFKASEWLANMNWDIPKHQVYRPVPWDAYRGRDSVATQELAALSGLLASRRDHRHVLWQIAEAAAELSGPHLQKLLEDAISTIDAQFEGMARAVGRHYPYLNSALSRGEKPDGCSDVLTPLVELWLLDDPTRDACIGRIMERADFHYFLFFGRSFARHLSNRRQEWLHRCLEKLQEPSAQVEPEFYSCPRRGPDLLSVAQLGAGWRGALLNVSEGWSLAPSAPPARRVRGRGPPSPSPSPSPSRGQQGPRGVQMYLWHPDTQAEFIQKAMYANTRTCLALLPRAEFADCIAEVKRKLESYPQEQTLKPIGKDLFGWEVIQAAAAYSDISAEVKRRFLEQPAPWVCDAMADPEAETLLWALGRCDLAEPALKILGGFTNAKAKLRQAKAAVTKLMRHVGPAKARDLIKEVMMPRKAGVGLQTAGLRMIVELQIPEPLELYKAAWSNGKCPRDVAGIILAKVNQSRSFAPEDVRSFFDFFKDMAGQQDECIYVAGLLLDQLADVKTWSLPFLPEVVAELAMLPGMTAKAVSALKSSTSHVTEVVGALTKVLASARLATRMARLQGDSPQGGSGSDQPGPEAQVLADLSKLSASPSLRDTTNSVRKMDLAHCEPSVLLRFVGEVMRKWRDEASGSAGSAASSLLECALALWVQLLRPGQQEAWAEVLSSMEARLARQGRPADLAAMASAVAGHVPGMQLNTEEHEAMLATAGDLFEGLLDRHLASEAWSPALTGCLDKEFEQQNKERFRVAKEVLKHWAKLLARGCTERESGRLFARCPDSFRLDLATTIVKSATEESKKQQDAIKRWRQKRPSDGWTHEGGIPAEKVKVGSVVDGTVTNSSAAHGVFFNFGCVRDGKLNCPSADWKKYRVGDEVKGMIVNKVDIKPQQAFIELILMRQDEGSAQGQFVSWEVACRAVRWLSTPVESRCLHFSTLAGLWASVAALNCGELTFEASLDMLGANPPAGSDGVLLVQELLNGKHKPEKVFVRQALGWLGRLQPEEAVRLWPALFSEKAAPEASEAAEAGDVQALLTLCEEHRLEPPEVPAVVARGLSDEVLDLFFASSIPEARLVAVQALSERHLNLEEMPALLHTLSKDDCEVVAVAARRLLASLEPDKAFKEGAHPKEGEDEQMVLDYYCSDEESEDEDEEGEDEDQDNEEGSEHDSSYESEEVIALPC